MEEKKLKFLQEIIGYEGFTPTSQDAPHLARCLNCSHVDLGYRFYKSIPYDDRYKLRCSKCKSGAIVEHNVV